MGSLLGSEYGASLLRRRRDKKVNLAVRLSSSSKLRHILTIGHPYDDPEYLKTLPVDHPAHPESKEAQEARKLAENETVALRKRQQAHTERQSQPKEDNDRNWFQKKKDQAIGTKEERRQAKEEKHRAKEEQRRRIRVSPIPFTG